MKNLYLVILLGSTISLIGCVTAQSIKPQDVKSYKTPQSLIEAKRLNGKDGNGNPLTTVNHREAVVAFIVMHLYKPKIFTGNDLGMLANVEQLPEGSFSADENTHSEARKFLSENNIEEAWKVLTV